MPRSASESQTARKDQYFLDLTFPSNPLIIHSCLGPVPRRRFATDEGLMINPPPVARRIASESHREH